MSEQTTFPSLTDVRAPFEEMDLPQLHDTYEQVFGESATVEKDGDLVQTTDKDLIIRKLAYANLLQKYHEAGEEVPARTATMAQKAFDAKFTKTGSRASRDNTIQAFIVKRLWGLKQADETASVQQLGDEVVQNFPDSTYSKDPVGRMRVDINKFNKGLFPYGVANNMVPAADDPFVPYVEPKPEKAAADEGNDE